MISKLRRLTYMAVLGAAILAPLALGAEESTAEPRFEAVLLGTGIPLPNPDRACAATLIIAGDKKFLVDTGRGSFMRLVTNGHLDLSAVLYTHFHNDHISELGEIMVNRAINGATEPMPIMGPIGTRRIATELLAPYRADTEYRVAHHGDKYAARAMTTDVLESEPGIIYDKDGLIIRMFDVDHPPILPAVGYRFDYNGKSIVVSGDTMKSPRLIEAAKDCDLLIHAVINKQFFRGLQMGMRKNNPKRAEMIGELMEYHTDRLEVAEVARETNAKKLVLTHLVPSIPPNDAAEKNFIRGMSDIYDGEIIVARDGMVVTP